MGLQLGTHWDYVYVALLMGVGVCQKAFKGVFFSNYLIFLVFFCFYALIYSVKG